MSDETKEVFKMSDDMIVMVRELIQLSLLTGTNLVDHFRSFMCERSEEKPGYLVPTKDYVEAYNSMVLKLNEEAMKREEQAQKTAAVTEEDGA